MLAAKYFTHFGISQTSLWLFGMCCVPSGSVPVVLLVQRIQLTPVPMVCRYYDKSHFYPTRACATQFLWGSMAQHGHLTRDDLQNNPVPYEEARDVVVSLLRGKLVVGHDVGHNLRALHCQHPPADVRDTEEHYSVERCRELGLIGPEGLVERCQGLRYSLKDLVRVVYKSNIQQARHNSVEPVV